MGQFTFDNHFKKEYLLAILQTGADYFPDILGKVFIYNAPASYYVIWKLMKRFFQKDTLAKFILTKDSKPIRKELGRECLLMKFGGNVKVYLFDEDMWENKEIPENVIKNNAPQINVQQRVVFGQRVMTQHGPMFMVPVQPQAQMVMNQQNFARAGGSRVAMRQMPVQQGRQIQMLVPTGNTNRMQMQAMQRQQVQNEANPQNK